MGYSGRKTLRRLNLFDKMWLYPHKDFEAFKKYRQPRFRKETSNSPSPPPPKKRDGKVESWLGKRRGS